MHIFELAADWRGEELHGPHPTISLTRRGGKIVVAVDAPFAGDPLPTGPAGRLWKLWEHEVVELFVLGENHRYIELELGPHGHYLFIGFDGRRSMADDDLPLHRYAAQIDGDRWRGEALFDTALLPAGADRFNLYAIAGPTRVHRALFAADGDAPDFHRLECFGDLPDL